MDRCRVCLLEEICSTASSAASQAKLNPYRGRDDCKDAVQIKTKYAKELQGLLIKLFIYFLNGSALFKNT